MLTRFFIALSLSGLILKLVAQNLISDGGFEDSPSSECITPDQGFSITQHWYPLDATPDLFKSNCPFDETDNFYWDASVKAYEGNNFAGLSGRWNSNSTYVSEGIATELTQPLKAGITYFFSMVIKNQGGYQGLADLTFCVLRPEKHIDIYLSTDSIFLTNNFSNGTAISSGSLAAMIDPDAIKSTLIGEWTKVTTCFRAEGGERYLALQMPLGTFGDLPACANNASSGVFRSFYYFVDDLTLTSFATTLKEEVAICQDGEVFIDLQKTFGSSLPVDLTFLWQDGYIGSERVLKNAGRYSIAANIACGEIPVELILTGQNCSPDFFAPNVFTPDGDGINDSFQLFVPDESNIQKFQLIIFDRWGNKIFQTSNSRQTWDGTIRNTKAPSGTYVWGVEIEIENIRGKEIISKGGSFTLLR